MPQFSHLIRIQGKSILLQALILVSALINDIKNINFFSIFVDHEVNKIVLNTDPTKAHISPRLLRYCLYRWSPIGQFFDCIQKCIYMVFCCRFVDQFFCYMYKAILLKDSSDCFVIFTLYKSIQFTHYSMPNIVNRRHFSIFCLTQSLCHSGIKFCTSHVA